MKTNTLSDPWALMDGKQKKKTFVDWLNKLYSVICITVVVR